MNSNIVCERLSDMVRVARFVRPDVRDALYDHEVIGLTSLYKELHHGAIAGLPTGGTVILNMGLVDWFPTAFYRLMIQALQDVRALGGRVAVCCLSENVLEGFEIMGGPRLFEVFPTEARTLASLGTK